MALIPASSTMASTSPHREDVRLIVPTASDLELPVIPPPLVGRGPARLESRLGNVGRQARTVSAAAAVTAAREARLAVVGERVRVVFEARLGPSALRFAISASGGTVEREAGDLVQALVPMAALEQLSARMDVSYVRPPFEAWPDAIVTEGVTATNASAWQLGGWNGAGTKVAIVDTGFIGYLTRQTSGDLPMSAIPVNYCP